MTNTVTPSRAKTSAMIASIAEPGQKTASAPFGHALVALAEQDPTVVGLSADLAKYTDMHIFRDRFPERFFQVGMAEQVLPGLTTGYGPSHQATEDMAIFRGMPT